MKIHENVSLNEYSTMHLGGKATYFAAVDSVEDAVEAVDWAKQNNQKIITIGGGSNIIFKDEGFDGLVLKSSIEIVDITPDSDSYVVKAGSGVIWDKLVEKTAQQDLTGIEALSLIPGTVGGAPVQNIGAYGQQLEDTFVELEAIDTASGEIVALKKEECGFGYRTSIFKDSQHGRYVILSMTLKLKKGSMQPEFYHVLQKYLDDHNIADYSPATIRRAVIEIRQSKLPDPSSVANTGSFFKNPIVTSNEFDQIKQNYPEAPGFEQANGDVKLSAGWLLEQAGYQNFRHKNGMGTYEKHPLVVVNYGAKEFADLQVFANEVVDNVQEKFGITLEIEPEILPKT